MFWSVYARIYDLLWDTAMTREVAESVIRELPLPPHQVLEVGAGTGLVTAQLVAGGYEVTAHEPSQPMLARLRRRLPDVTSKSMEIGDLSGDSGELTTLVAVNVVHLVENQDRAIDQLRRAVGPEGKVVVVTPIPDASVAKAVRAQRVHGASRHFAARFWLLHALLAPITNVTRTRRECSPGGWRSAGYVNASRPVSDVSRLYVLSGTGTDQLEN